MEDRIPHVLKRLDEWIYQRSRKHYTSDASSQLIKEISNVFSNNNSKLGRKLLPLLGQVLSVSNQLREAENYFSNKYSSLEKILEERNLLMPLCDMAQEVREEYLMPLIESLVPLKKFVEEVKENYSRIFPNELED